MLRQIYPFKRCLLFSFNKTLTLLATVTRAEILMRQKINFFRKGGKSCERNLTHIMLVTIPKTTTIIRGIYFLNPTLFLNHEFVIITDSPIIAGIQAVILNNPELEIVSRKTNYATEY